MAGAVGFSGKAVFAKLLYAHGVDAITVVALRMLWSLPMFLVLMHWPRPAADAAPLAWRDWLAATGLGLLGYYVSSVLDFFGLLYITVSLERLILFLYPTLVLVISAAWLRQAIGWWQWAALALTYSGIGLSFAHDLSVSEPDAVMHGGLLVFGAAVTYAGYILASGRYIRRLGSARFVGHAMVAATTGVLVQFLLERHPAELLPPIDIAALVAGLALLGTVMPSILLSEGLKRVGPSRTALLSTLGPVATIGLGHWVLGEPVSAPQLVGAALVISGVGLVTVKKP